MLIKEAWGVVFQFVPKVFCGVEGQASVQDTAVLPLQPWWTMSSWTSLMDMHKGIVMLKHDLTLLS